MNLFKITVFFLCCSFSISCSENDIPEDHVAAIITGIDARRCACCGGAMITLSDNDELYLEPYYQWYDYTRELDLSFDSSFPVNVYVQFNEDNSQCASSLGIINVKSILQR